MVEGVEGLRLGNKVVVQPPVVLKSHINQNTRKCKVLLTLLENIRTEWRANWRAMNDQKKGLISLINY